MSGIVERLRFMSDNGLFAASLVGISVSYSEAADTITDLLAALEGWQDLHDAMIEAGGDMQQLPDGLIEKFAVVQSGLMVSTRAAIAKAGAA